jgi:Na+/H+ antiporter NhaD and related arsenite permeases
MLKLLIAILIFVATLLLVNFKPRGIPIGYSALIGGALTLILGISNIHDVVLVFDIVWDATFTFVAIIIMTLILDEAGFFDYIASKILGLGNRLGKAFVLLLLLDAVVSALFANDGAALVMTPIATSIISRSSIDERSRIVFMLGIGFVADTASLPFIISNLVNIIDATYFNISFLLYAEYMIFPFIISVVVSVVLYYFLLVRTTDKNQELPSFQPTINDQLLVKLGFPFIAILVLAYFLTSFVEIPVAMVAIPAATLLGIIAKRRKKIDVYKVVREAPWQIVLFSLGMYIVVFGMGKQGVTNFLASTVSTLYSLPSPFNVIMEGLLFAFTAAIMNNLPSVMINSLAINATHSTNQFLLALVNVISNDIGPKFTPIGSLATLLWIYSLERKHGVKIPLRIYVYLGLITTPIVLVATILSLWILFL